jgi:hypothetical protein
MKDYRHAFGVLLLAAVGGLTHPARGAEPQADAASMRKAEELLSAARQASGGQAWDKVVTWHETGKVTSGGLSGHYESWVDLTSLHNSSSYELGPVSGGSGWDGRQAWTTDSSKEVRLESSAETVAQALQDAYRSAWGFFFPARFKAQRTFVGSRSAADRKFDVVKITPEGAEPFEVWLDPASHRVVREVQLTGGQPHTFMLEDFTSFDGVMAPRRTIDRVGNDPKFDTVSEVTAIRFSGPEQLARYAPPPAPPNTAQWPAGKDSVSMPFRLLNNHIYVDASINGAAPLPFVFDTGAVAILQVDALRKLGIKGEGALAGGGFGDKIEEFGFAKVRSVSLGGLTLPDQVFGTESSPGWVAIEGADSSGLLGYEFVKRAVLSIDYAHSTMTFTRQDRFRPPAGVTAVPFTFNEHVPMIAGSLDGFAGEFELDTGSRGALTVMHPFAMAHGLIEKYHATRSATVGYGVGGPSRALLARAGELQLGSLKIKAPVTEIVTDKAGAAAAARTAGNIGGDLLKRYTVTLDYASRQVWFQPNALAERPEVFDRSGLWIARAKDGGIRVEDVATESAAARIGLSSGDVIRSINGKAASQIPLYTLREEFKGAIGTPFKLEIAGKDGKARSLTLVLADQV